MAMASSSSPVGRFSGVVKPEHVDAINQNKSAQLVISDSKNNCTTYNVSLDEHDEFVFKLDIFFGKKSPKPEHSDAIEKIKFDLLIHSNKFELMAPIVASNIADGTLISTIKDMSPFRACSIVSAYISLKTTQEVCSSEYKNYDVIELHLPSKSDDVIQLHPPFESDDVIELYHPFESDDFHLLTKMRPDIAVVLTSNLKMNFPEFDIENELLKVLESGLTSAQEIENFIDRVPSHLWQNLAKNDRFTTCIDKLTGNSKTQLTVLISLTKIHKHCPLGCASTDKISLVSTEALATVSKKNLGDLKDISLWELLVQRPDFIATIQRVMPQGAGIDKDSEAIMVNILKVSPKIFADLFPHLTDHSSGRLLFEVFSQALSADDISEDQFEQLINEFNQTQSNFLKEFGHLYEWLLFELNDSNPKRAIDIYLSAQGITPSASSSFVIGHLVKSADALLPINISQEKYDVLKSFNQSNLCNEQTFRVIHRTEIEIDQSSENFDSIVLNNVYFK